MSNSTLIIGGENYSIDKVQTSPVLTCVFQDINSENNFKAGKNTCVTCMKSTVLFKKIFTQSYFYSVNIRPSLAAYATKQSNDVNESIQTENSEKNPKKKINKTKSSKSKSSLNDQNLNNSKSLNEIYSEDPEAIANTSNEDLFTKRSDLLKKKDKEESAKSSLKKSKNSKRESKKTEEVSKKSGTKSSKPQKANEIIEKCSSSIVESSESSKKTNTKSKKNDESTTSISEKKSKTPKSSEKNTKTAEESINKVNTRRVIAKPSLPTIDEIPESSKKGKKLNKTTENVKDTNKKVKKMSKAALEKARIEKMEEIIDLVRETFKDLDEKITFCLNTSQDLSSYEDSDSDSDQECAYHADLSSSSSDDGYEENLNSSFKIVDRSEKLLPQLNSRSSKNIIGENSESCKDDNNNEDIKT